MQSLDEPFQEPAMPSQSKRAVAGVTLVVVVAAIHFSGVLQAAEEAPAAAADPSVPPASAALSNAKAPEGNVPDFTY
jgi:hypothetical protein